MQVGWAFAVFNSYIEYQLLSFVDRLKYLTHILCLISYQKEAIFFLSNMYKWMILATFNGWFDKIRPHTIIKKTFIWRKKIRPNISLNKKWMV